MKKVTLGTHNTRKLTETVKMMQSRNYKQYARPAQSHGGDTVYVMMNMETHFTLEYCVKVRKVDNKPFVNWARVVGPDEVVNKFLQAIEHVDYIVDTNQVVIPQL